VRFCRLLTPLFSLIPLLLGACSPLTLVNVVVPDDTYERTTGVSYGPAPRQRLDVYRPAGPAGEAAASPVIVFFYGGSWKGGDRRQYRFVAEAFARRGFMVVIPDYRVYPEVRFPAFVEDGAAVVRWVSRHIGDFGGNPDRVFLAGHSAGAHIAALLAVDGRYLAADGGAPGNICGVASVAGPLAFDPTSYDSVKAIFQDADRSSTRPVKRVTAGAPPFLLLHGAADETVYPKNATEFADAMRAYDRPVDLHLIPGIGHYRILLSMASPFEWIAPVNDRIASFVAAGGACRTPGFALHSP
jgi:acetyl esterase/lipase